MFPNGSQSCFCKADILRKKLTWRNTKTTGTDKVGLQPWTAGFALFGARHHGVAKRRQQNN